MAELTLTVDVDAPPQAVFDAMVDWDRQGEWMLGTTVRGTVNQGKGLGGWFEAYTGRKPFGFNDPMEITRWQEPSEVAVLHHGKVVKGTGLFEVVDLGGGRSRFVWSEQIDLPLGAVGRFGWFLVRPLAAAGISLSLRRFARWAPTRTAV